MLKLAFLNEFREILINCSNVVCIGTGIHLKKMRVLFPVLNEKITFLADNSPEKYKKNYTLSENKTITISSVDEIGKVIKTDTIILIACFDYTSILEQITKYPWFNSTDVYCSRHLTVLVRNDKALSKKIPDNLKIYDKPCIPKVIHYCWFGGNPVPDKYKKWIDSWKKYCPDYEIIQWNESNYDVTKNKYMYQAYQAKKWGFVPDYARLDIIYNHGGIYLDTDVELIKNIDELLYQKAFAGFENDNSVALGLGFGAEKGHPIIKELMDYYNNLDFVDSNGEMKLTASPIYQTEVFLKHGLVQNGEYQVIDDFTIFPEKMLCGKSSYMKVISTADYTCSIHHYEASWVTEETRKKNIQFENEMNMLFNRDKL